MQRTGTAWQLFARIGTDGLAVLLWLALVAFSLFGLQDAIRQFHYPDPDDAMRLAQVRDLMAGQSWFDVNQYRVNPGEGGGLMHWSRLVDASIVSLILLLQPLLGEAAGERWALALQPLLLILPLFMLLGRIFALLGGRQLIVVGLLIASTSVTFLQFFVPMRIDHHGWQLLLSVAMFWIALRPATLANGAGSGSDYHPAHRDFAGRATRIWRSSAGCSPMTGFAIRRRRGALPDSRLASRSCRSLGCSRCAGFNRR